MVHIEKFVKITGYELYYEVSNFGRVKSLRRKWVSGFKEDTIKSPALGTGGYPYIFFNVDAIAISARIHRLVALHFHENPNNYRVVNHLNSIRHDNRSFNLEWTTQKKNVKHAIEHGFQNSMIGAKNVMAKITEDDVRKIREMYNSGNISQRELSEKFKIHNGAVSMIITRKRWKHIN